MTDESEEFSLADDDEPTPAIVSSADAIYDELRTICHESLPGTSIPAPVAYKVLGNLKGVEYMLPQALSQLAAASANLWTPMTSTNGRAVTRCSQLRQQPII
ncbi:hypothetical protein GM708_15920 [Vibrio cholerae]|nr:hypothetical protein [Vibrio cholerae]